MDPQISKQDVQFFDLAYLDVKSIVNKKNVQIELKDFVIPNMDLLPSDVRSEIKHWSDLIDYWAVDFDFRNDTFVNTWQTYRTRDETKLALKSMSHEYPAHGKHKVLVKVVDVFGIDSCRELEVEI